jgi:hypothetical protein
MSFTCPVCLMTSHNPNDERYGYCGNCHDYTGCANNQHVWEFDPQEYGGATCRVCGLRDKNEKGER